MANILIIDDEASFQDLVGQVLRKAGYEVSVAGTGEEGLDRLVAVGADLVVLDVNLPGISGFDVCAAMRKDPKLTRIPVLMLTVNRRPEAQALGLRSGADDYLPKPFKPDELRARVFALLRRTR